jgi:CO/xanthine dehydrogenase Mo-binding subunit
VELGEDGRICNVTAAHDVGTPVNPLSLEGQIEGGVVMSLGYALTEDFPLENGRPTRKFGTLGLFKANGTPNVDALIVGIAGKDGLACGAKGIGEICSIPTAPAVQLAYYLRDGNFRTKLPLEDTPLQQKVSSSFYETIIRRQASLFSDACLLPFSICSMHSGKRLLRSAAARRRS